MTTKGPARFFSLGFFIWTLALSAGCQHGAKSSESKDNTRSDAYFFYQTNLLGESEPCHCPSGPMGGLARAHRLLNRADAKNTDFIVHTGGLLWNSEKSKYPPSKEKMLAYAKLLRSAGFQVANVARGDLVWGPEFLQRLSKDSLIQFVAANIVLADGTRPFPAFVIKQTGGEKVAFTGLATDENAPFVNSVDSLVRAVDDARSAGAQKVVVLLHGTPAEMEKVLRRSKSEIDLVIASGPHSFLPEPSLVEGIPVVEAAALGRFMGFAAWTRVHDDHAKAGSKGSVLRHEITALDSRYDGDVELDKAVADYENKNKTSSEKKSPR